MSEESSNDLSKAVVEEVMSNKVPVGSGNVQNNLDNVINSLVTKNSAEGKTKIMVLNHDSGDGPEQEISVVKSDNIMEEKSKILVSNENPREVHSLKTKIIPEEESKIFVSNEDFSNGPRQYMDLPEVKDVTKEETDIIVSCDSPSDERDQCNGENYDSAESPESQKKDGILSPKSFLEGLDLEVPSSYEVEPVDFPNSPWFSIARDSQLNPLSDEEEDKSMYQAQLLSNCQDVRLCRDETVHAGGRKKKIIPVGNDIFTDSCCDDSSLDGSHTDDAELDAYLDSPDELDDSIMERLGREDVEPIPELTAEEERMEARAWKPCVIAGIERRLDLKVLEPYKRVVSHGGYLSQGSHNAIIVFSACYLPDRSRVDYDYVMNNLFMYVITTLDQLVTDDYVLIYLHGATSRSCMPKFKWLKQCYQMIDRKLRKNLKGLYLVHPTFWLKTLVLMTKPFISSKFSRKLFFVYSLSELFKMIPLEQASIPDRVKKYDELKETLEKTH